MTKITAENVTNFPIGTRVRFFWGCPESTGEEWDTPQEEEGLVVEHRTKPASKWFPASVQLVVETATGREHLVSSFTTKGIGAYLVDRAEEQDT